MKKQLQRLLSFMRRGWQKGNPKWSREHPDYKKPVGRPVGMQDSKGNCLNCKAWKAEGSPEVFGMWNCPYCDARWASPEQVERESVAAD